MMKKLCILLVILFSAVLVNAQDKSLYEKHWFIQGNDTMPYRVLLPLNFDPAKKYPLIVFLHGSGERGNDNEKQLVHGAKLFLRDSIREKYPAIVVFPQCSQSSYWSNVKFLYSDDSKKRTGFEFQAGGEPTTAMRLLMELLKTLQHDYKLNKKQLYVGGLSMGGMGTFELVSRKPKMFAAAFPICGGANEALAKKMKQPKWWIFHGLKDDVVSPEFSKKMADAIQQQGGSVKLTLYPDANHNSWDAAFAEKDLLQWLFAQHK